MESGSANTVLCLAGFEKGHEFIRACKRQGSRVILVTVSSLEAGDWPRESIDEFFHMPDLYVVDNVVRGVSYLARTRQIDRIVALDDPLHDLLDRVHVGGGEVVAGQC